ncbi:TIGR03643 family protein [Lishizhenia tianjinensis]|uniref:TIGR03643 family protein n=1 Tax=Lishizhenia tianjinensis TaxID=477690 RepID=A0A1I6XET7_9FLAO|nr:TIGR03643 family protein [Lishizhenia tianjinensis]SFT36621.1 TIGR03643 family protein [Lishizhenia tianjinensis]
MELTARNIDRIIEMAWEDRTPFDAIEFQFGLPEQEVIKLMRRELKEKSFKRWRRRAQQRGKLKHRALRSDEVKRFKCSRQRSISQNKIT